MTMRAFWFEPANGKLGYRDGRVPEVGVTHTVEGNLQLCEFGLHASKRAIDALKYAQSNVIWLVELDGEILHGDDKSCATQRTYIKRLDAEKILFACSRQFALSVAHLWNMPSVVRQFLETGDQSLRDAARDAAQGAAATAAADAAARAARVAVAAWAAEDADAAVRAARVVASEAAADAAAGAATDSAAWAAAWAATDAAATDAQNNLLEHLILKEMGES